MSGVFAVAKAFPIAKDFIDKFIDEWTSKEVHESEQIRVSFRAEKLALNRAIARAETNEDIKQLSITLRRLNNGKLSKDASTIL